MSEVINAISQYLNYLPVVRIIISCVMVLLLPGFAWTLVFLTQLTLIERVAFSFGLSIVVVILSLFFASRLIGISGFNCALVIIAVAVLPVAVYYLNRFIRRKRQGVT